MSGARRGDTCGGRHIYSGANPAAAENALPFLTAKAASPRMLDVAHATAEARALGRLSIAPRAQAFIVCVPGSPCSHGRIIR